LLCGMYLLVDDTEAKKPWFVHRIPSSGATKPTDAPDKISRKAATNAKILNLS
jgi:hypothetical protein